MTKEVITVNEDTLITDVAKLLTSNRIHAVPVLNAERQLVGIITESDFFSKNSPALVYLPTVVDFVRSGKLHELSDRAETVEAVHNALAESVMSSPCVTISEDADVQDFLNLFRERGFNTAPVVNANGQMVGIVAVADALKLI